MTRSLARLHSAASYAASDRRYLSGASKRAAFLARAENRASRKAARQFCRSAILTQPTPEV